jgi:hypothetical protein
MTLKAQNSKTIQEYMMKMHKTANKSLAWMQTTLRLHRTACSL